MECLTTSDNFPSLLVQRPQLFPNLISPQLTRLPSHLPYPHLHLSTPKLCLTPTLPQPSSCYVAPRAPKPCPHIPISPPFSLPKSSLPKPKLVGCDDNTAWGKKTLRHSEGMLYTNWRMIWHIVLWRNKLRFTVHPCLGRGEQLLALHPREP